MQIAQYRELKQRETAKHIPGLSTLMEIAERAPSTKLNQTVARIALSLGRTSIAKKGLTDKKLIAAAYRMAVYESFWIRQPENYFPATHNPDRIFVCLFEWLFVRYRYPAFFLNELIDHCPTLNEMNDPWARKVWFDESDVLRSIIRMAQGSSVKSCHLPGRLTAAGAHHFPLAPCDLSYREAVRWAQVKGAKGSDELARTIVNSRLGNNFREDEFWLTVIEFLARQNLLEMSSVNVVIDYIHQIKFVPDLQPDGTQRITQPGFQIKGRTMQSLLAGAERWHTELTRSSASKKDKWVSCGIPNYYAESKSYEYTIVELLDTKELRLEGKALSHCVVSYASLCRKRLSAVFSVQKLERENPCAGRQRILTIEVRLPKDVVQARGKYNSGPTPEAENLLMAFAVKNGLNRRV